jgi:sphinganine-1-phosphate aldolase
VSVRVPFPEKGKNPEEVIKTLNDSKGGDFKWDLGKVFCLTYPVDESHHQFLKEAYGSYISENFLNPMAFGSLKKNGKRSGSYDS